MLCKELSYDGNLNISCNYRCYAKGGSLVGNAAIHRDSMDPTAGFYRDVQF